MGKHCLGLASQDPSGRVVSRPSMKQVLLYEFELRKRAYRFVNEGGLTLTEAFDKARAGTETKQAYLTGPWHQNTAGAQAVGHVPPPPPLGVGVGKAARKGDTSNKGSKGAGRGGGGKAADRDSNGLCSSTPGDNRQMCFA